MTRLEKSRAMLCEQSQQSALLHVHDLPQLYTHPSGQVLLDALDMLQISPSSFSRLDVASSHRRQVDETGVPRYLTSIISSSLSWLESDESREKVWDSASARLSERSGRNAMPDMTRAFDINSDLTINLHEPSLTEDNLGLKTWTSSLLLARRLPLLKPHLSDKCTRVLELGAGTGLVGIAAAVLWGMDVLLTDLPVIVTNLQKNVEANSDFVEQQSIRIQTRALDWSDVTDHPATDSERFQTILAADPIYSDDHPAMLVNTVQRWLVESQSSRFIVELPLRQGYQDERDKLKFLLDQSGMECVEQGTEIGYDDWQRSDGSPAEVECWWSVWRPRLTTDPE